MDDYCNEYECGGTLPLIPHTIRQRTIFAPERQALRRRVAQSCQSIQNNIDCP